MKIRITVDGKLALTIEQAAERYGVALGSMRSTLSRLGVTSITKFDGRKPLYLATELDRIMRNRPGRGAPGVPRAHRPAKPED